MAASQVDKLWLANNEGAKLVAKGRYQDAFLLLRSAIDQASVDPFKMVNQDMCLGGFTGIGIIPLSAPRITFAEGECVLHHDVFPLPFVIYPQRGNTIQDDNTRLLAGTSAALFNMALSRHRQFFLSHCPAMRRQLLAEACKLYQTIYHMLGHVIRKFKG